MNVPGNHNCMVREKSREKKRGKAPLPYWSSPVLPKKRSRERNVILLGEKRDQYQKKKTKTQKPGSWRGIEFRQKRGMEKESGC